jgi:hypothetical protein
MWMELWLRFSGAFIDIQRGLHSRAPRTNHRRNPKQYHLFRISEADSTEHASKNPPTQAKLKLADQGQTPEYFLANQFDNSQERGVE